MTAISYKANFIKYLSAEGEALPDEYRIDKSYTPPSDDFVISRSKDGKALSVYGDDVWDFRQYRLAGDTGYAKMRFVDMPNDLKEEVKWLMFLLIYVVDSGRATGLSISTLMVYLKVL